MNINPSISNGKTVSIKLSPTNALDANAPIKLIEIPAYAHSLIVLNFDCRIAIKANHFATPEMINKYIG
jgi:hypothetical protein